MTKKEKKENEEEVCSTFVEGEKTIKTCGEIPKKHASKEQLMKQNKLLRNVIIIVGLIFATLIITYLILNNMKYFDAEGIQWDAVKSGSILFYHTSFKVYDDRGIHTANYNVYLRKNPRKTFNDIEFEGNLSLREMMIIESNEDFICDGDGAISVANMAQILNGMGIQVAKDPNATCDDQGRYMHVLLQPGEKTRIEQSGPTCYNIYVKDCEILEGTERFTLEALKQITKDD